jgi:hypothetical protein
MRAFAERGGFDIVGVHKEKAATPGAAESYRPQPCWQF